MKVLMVAFALVLATGSAAAQSVTPHHDCPEGDWDNLEDTLKKASRVVLARGLAKRSRRDAPEKQTFEVLSTLKGDALTKIALDKPDNCGRVARAGALVIIISLDDGYLLKGWGSERLWQMLVTPVESDKDAVEATVSRVVAKRWPTYRRIKVQYKARAGETMKAEKAKVRFVKRSKRGLAICSAQRYGNIVIIRGNVRSEEDRLGFYELIDIQRITDKGLERLEGGRRGKVPRRSLPRCD